jgi:hypothetical protein
MHSLANYTNLMGVDGLFVCFCMVVALAIVAAIVVAAVLLAKRKKPGGSGAPGMPPAPGQEPLKTCDNCGRQIGKLEQTYTWKDTHTVCAECHARLQGQG